MNDFSVPRCLEPSIRLKERFNLVYTAQTFDPAEIADQPVKTKQDPQPIEKRIQNLRLQKSMLKQALYKKLRKSLTERLLTIFESQYLNMQVMGFQAYQDCI